MASDTPARRRGPTPSRSVAQITEAGVRLADLHGLPAVTMRAVASELRIAPAALYRYVASRDRLLETMVDRALEDLTLPQPVGGITEDLAALTRAQVEVLRRHPWLIDTMTTVRPGTSAIGMLEEGLRILAPSPASNAAKLEALAMLTGIATLFARSSAEPAPGTMAALGAATSTHPHLAAAFAEPGSASTPDALLERTVTALVRGLLP